MQVDDYIVDVLMRDLVGHDSSPASFLVYLGIWSRTLGRGAASAELSLQNLAESTGLSKSAVQRALRNLHRRRLIRSQKRHLTAIPEYAIRRPWVRRQS